MQFSWKEIDDRASNIPPLEHKLIKLDVVLLDLDNIIFLISNGYNEGIYNFNNAATPVTKGVALDVPPKGSYSLHTENTNIKYLGLSLLYYITKKIK